MAEYLSSATIFPPTPDTPTQQKDETKLKKGTLNNRTVTPMKVGLGAAGIAAGAVAGALFVKAHLWIPVMLGFAAAGPIGWIGIAAGATLVLAVIALAGITAYVATQIFQSPSGEVRESSDRLERWTTGRLSNVAKVIAFTLALPLQIIKTVGKVVALPVTAPIRFGAQKIGSENTKLLNTWMPKAIAFDAILAESFLLKIGYALKYVVVSPPSTVEIKQAIVGDPKKEKPLPFLDSLENTKKILSNELLETKFETPNIKFIKISDFEKLTRYNSPAG